MGWSSRCRLCHAVNSAVVRVLIADYRELELCVGHSVHGVCRVTPIGV